MERKMDGIGRVEVSSIPLPEVVTAAEHPIYTSSGMILFGYHPAEHAEEKDYYNIAVINDDGSDFRVIFSGLIPLKPTGNGFRVMPYADGKRVLLGDYVLEATPSLADCEHSALIPIEYPAELMTAHGTTHHWSEIVIAPDNQHMAWTSLQGFAGAINYLGVLNRQSDRYVLEKVQVISSTRGFAEDEANPGYLLPTVMRGGEIKQFVRGGTALSLAGSGGSSLPDSVLQDFLSESVTPITRSAGYDETTILSPDEHLGMVMSTRGSPKTNFAILGLMPRPCGAYVTMNLTMNAYLYGVTSVRAFRKGNVGPVLIDVARSMAEPGYPGVQLNDPEENWVYYSPMSWHPNGRSAIWPEGLRGTNTFRIQIVRLPDYQPAPAVASLPTPDEISYGVPIGQFTAKPQQASASGKIAGKHSGYARLTMENGAAKVEYFDMSDDGNTFYHGYEASGRDAEGGLTYQCEVTANGEQSGEMKLRLAFTPFLDWKTLPSLDFSAAADGKPKSTGFATCRGITLRVEDMQ